MGRAEAVARAAAAVATAAEEEVVAAMGAVEVVVEKELEAAPQQVQVAWAAQAEQMVESATKAEVQGERAAAMAAVDGSPDRSPPATTASPPHCTEHRLKSCVPPTSHKTAQIHPRSAAAYPHPCLSMMTRCVCQRRCTSRSGG